MSQYAKAIAAALTPFVVAAIVWFADNAGIDIKPDNEVIGAAVLAIVSAVFVYLSPKNSTPNPPEEG